jgi:phosphoribosylamine--glycine ligase
LREKPLLPELPQICDIYYPSGAFHALEGGEFLRVLILGSGAREHALAWAFSKSKRISGLFVAPGNAGTENVATNLPDTDPKDHASVARACLDSRIDLVFVGPEAPLAAGIVDYLNNENIPVIGPTKKATKLESSKIFSKNFMMKYGIPTAKAVACRSDEDLLKALSVMKGKVVIKKNGLASGKGVLESDDHKAILAFAQHILAEDSLLVEEFLEGYEISVFAVTDGENYLTLPPCADFKKAGDGDTGPNTGGMGAICPVPWVDSALRKRIEEEIVAPTFRGAKEEGVAYRGILYFGLMITSEGPKVLEYNVRMGDPETQAGQPLGCSHRRRFGRVPSQA